MRSALPEGDYSLMGVTDRLAIERKELDDLIACLMGSNWERFKHELHRPQFFDLAAVVVEGIFDDL